MRPALVVAVVMLTATSTPAQDKLPIPSETVQQETLELVQEVYGDEWKNAETSAQKQALATKLLEKALESTDDANRYVLLKVTRDVAAQAGDAGLAFKAIDAAASRYDVDIYKLRGAALSQAAKSAMLQKHRSTIAELSLQLIEQAVEKDDFVAAKFLGDLAVDAARRAKAYELTKRIVARNREIGEIAEAYAQLVEAFATLKDKPFDPRANLAVGRYYCFVKGHWDRGLPMLALSSDEELKRLAAKELGEVSATDEQVALGDGWWALASASEGMAARQLEGRAELWYRTALPTLSGLVKRKIENRLRNLQTVGGTSGETLASNAESDGWFVVFCSTDPSIWNTATKKDKTHFAVPLSEVPDDIKFLRLRVAPTRMVIIPITKGRLTQTSDDGRFGWNGTKRFKWNARQLGVYDKAMSRQKRGLINTLALGGRGYGGWGFGVRIYVDDRQGYTWAGHEIGKTVFEIAVKSGALSLPETRTFLKR